MPSHLDVKDGTESREEISPSNLKLDHAGLPLLPQPTTSPFDPLNYPNWLKYALLAQVSLLAFLATFNLSIINPAVVPLAAEFGISPVTGTYQAAVAIGTAALGPLVFTPFANVYGRRPAYLLSILIGFVSAVGSAVSKTYGTMIVVRAINGFGLGAALGLGVGTIVDVFYMHQRGRAVGVFTLMSAGGSKLSPIIGGFVARDLGWRWCFWVGAIVTGIMFFVCLFLMPETIFDRPHDYLDGELIGVEANSINSLNSGQEFSIRGELYMAPPLLWATYLNRLWIVDLQKPSSRRLKATDFAVKPLSMLKYPSVTLPALYFAVANGFAAIEPGLTLATVFTEIYHFDTVRNGLANGITLLIGASLGELCSGPVTDTMMQRARKKAIQQGTQAPAEVRLQVIWIGAIAVPIGLLICNSSYIHFSYLEDLLISLKDGWTIHFQTTFIVPCIGMAIAVFGSQIVTSACYTYSCSDCYRTRSNHVAMCYNVFRQVFGLTLGFYSIPFGKQIGFQWSFTLFAGLCITTFLPVIILMSRGERWRKRLGEPKGL